MANINLNPSPNPNPNPYQSFIRHVLTLMDWRFKDLITFRAWIKIKFRVLRTRNYYQRIPTLVSTSLTYPLVHIDIEIIQRSYIIRWIHNKPIYTCSPSRSNSQSCCHNSICSRRRIHAISRTLFFVSSPEINSSKCSHDPVAFTSCVPWVTCSTMDRPLLMLWLMFSNARSHSWRNFRSTFAMSSGSSDSSSISSWAFTLSTPSWI